METDPQFSTSLLLCGYVLEPRAAELKESKQPKKIGDFCRLHHYNLIFTEKETGWSRMIARPGLWRVTRALICYTCDSGDMPMSHDVEAWVNRALMPCRCDDPKSVDGIVVAEIGSICTDAKTGSKFALAMAINRKHLFCVDQGQCMSCCNPAAAPFLGGTRF